MFTVFPYNVIPLAETSLGYLMTPYYQHHLFFCTNQREAGKACCQNHDAQALRDYAKARSKELNLAGAGQVRVNTAGCMDRCAQGPVLVIYPQGVWYTYKTTADIDEIFHEHVLNGRIVARLKI